MRGERVSGEINIKKTGFQTLPFNLFGLVLLLLDTSFRNQRGEKGEIKEKC